MTGELEIAETLPPMHPGEVLREEFMIPMNLTAGKIAKACGMPRNRIKLTKREKLGIGGDTALRLSRLLGTSAELWMNLQKRYELETARRQIRTAIDQIARVAA